MKQCPPDYKIERYAADVIADNPENFNGIEVHGVRSYQTGADSHTYEVDDLDPEAYSVYLHVVTGGVECVGDFTRRVDAQEYAREIGAAFAWEIHDYTRQEVGKAA